MVPFSVLLIIMHQSSLQGLKTKGSSFELVSRVRRSGAGLLMIVILMR